MVVFMVIRLVSLNFEVILLDRVFWFVIYCLSVFRIYVSCLRRVLVLLVIGIL